jgi:glucose-1-phosphate thymidylyltransferase
MRERIAILPAAGQATRLGERAGPRGALGAPCKEVLPIGGEPVAGKLLRACAAAGLARALVVTRPEKRDIVEALGDGSRWGLPVVYRFLARSRSVPDTLAQGLCDEREAEIVLGFPDVLYQPPGALTTLVREFARRAADDVLLGLFPTDRPDKADMVAVDGGRITELRVKPGPCELRWTWLLAVWRPSFSRLLIEAVACQPAEFERELQVSDVLSAAIAQGLAVGGIEFPGGSHLDIGTPEDLARARRLYGP